MSVRVLSVRRWAGAACAAALVISTSACSGSAVERYCAEVEAQQTPITEAAAAGATGLLQALPSFEALRDEAPDDIAPAWAVVVQRLTVLDDALAEADVDPATYDLEDPPADLGDDDRAAIAAAASGLLTEAMVDALDAVQQQARDVCKTPLSL